MKLYLGKWFIGLYIYLINKICCYEEPLDNKTLHKTFGFLLISVLFKNALDSHIARIMKQMSSVMRKPTYAKTKVQISLRVISASVFTTGIVLFFYFQNPKFSASSHLLWLYRSVCVGPVRKPHCLFSHNTAQMMLAAVVCLA